MDLRDSFDEKAKCLSNGGNRSTGRAFSSKFEGLDRD